MQQDSCAWGSKGSGSVKPPMWVGVATVSTSAGREVAGVAGVGGRCAGSGFDFDFDVDVDVDVGVDVELAWWRSCT